MDQVVADAAGDLAAAGMVGDHQQHVPARQVMGDVAAGGLVEGLVGFGAADPAVLVVGVQGGGIAGAQAEGGVAFPLRR